MYSVEPGTSRKHEDCEDDTDDAADADEDDDDDVQSLKMYWRTGQWRALQRSIPACYREHEAT